MNPDFLKRNILYNDAFSGPKKQDANESRKACEIYLPVLLFHPDLNSLISGKP